MDYVSDIIDCYFVVNGRKSKTGDVSDVYLAVNKNGNFISPADNSDWDKLKKYATYLQQNYFKQFQLNNQLKDVEREIGKKYQKLTDINKQKADLETGISKDSTLISTLQSQLMDLRSKKN